MSRGRPPYPDVLTPREQEVLALIRQGLTNGQIATRLGISESGARYHVSEILSKLGVSSRQEAARWDGERVLPSFGLVAWLRPAIAALKNLPLAVVSVGIVALLALALGVAVMAGRGSGGGPPSGGEDSASERTAELQALLDLAEEATVEARAQLPGASLYFVAYARPSRLYTFRFSQPGSQIEVSVLGPDEGDPDFARWEMIREERPADYPVPTHLDLSAARNSFEAVAEAAAARSLSSTANMGVVLFSDGGELTWSTMARPGGIFFISCQAPDSDRSLMTCDRATQVPGGLPLEPTP